jgi:hypothetical protein
LAFWQNFTLGLAPLVIGMFFFGSIQLFFIGMVGEYIGSIHTLVQRRPLALERERINFEFPPGIPLAEEFEPAGSIPLVGYPASVRNGMAIVHAALEKAKRNG